MRRFFENIRYYLLSQKEQQRLKTRYENSQGKQFIGNGAKLTINNEMKDKIKQVRENVTEIVKQTNCEPQKLFEYIRFSQTPLFINNDAQKLLNLIKEEEGIIYEKEGIEALYLNLITGQGFKFTTKPMFFITSEHLDRFFLLHNFYRWYSLKTGLPGFDYKTQRLFKLFLYSTSTNFEKSLSMEEIINLQEAVARDKEATDYVLEYTKQIEGSKKVLNKIKNEGGANI